MNYLFTVTKYFTSIGLLNNGFLLLTKNNNNNNKMGKQKKPKITKVGQI